MVQEESEYSHVHLLVKKTLYVPVASAWKLTIVFLLAGTLGVGPEATEALKNENVFAAG